MSERLRIDVVTLFPETIRAALDASIPARALGAGLVDVRLHALREHGLGTHRQVDDAPFGGGAGMVMRPEPLFTAVEAITERPAGTCPPDEAIVLLHAAGEPFTQARARRFAKLSRLVLICGRYEGVDDRVRTHLCTETLSLGDYVLSGGEPAAIAVIDAVVRLVPGALGNAESAESESYEDGLLEAPHFTRPASFRGIEVPAELLSGHHAEIARWRRAQSILLTARQRPDLLDRAVDAGRVTRRETDALAATMAEDDGAPGRAPEGSESRTTNDPAASAGRTRLKS